MYKNIICLIAMLLTINGCATTESMKNETNLKEGHGVLLANINAKQALNMQFVDYSPNNDFGSRLAEGYFGPAGSINANPNKKFWVLSVPAGVYMWGVISSDKAQFNYFSRSKFVIEEGKINYIGNISTHLIYNGLQMLVSDKPKEAREYLDTNYPTLISKYPFTKNLLILGLKPE